MRILVLCLGFLWLAQPALAAKLALVIGNSTYAHLEDLRNPGEDAMGYRGALEELGYEVFFFTNLDRVGMENAVIDFADKISPGDDAFFVFSGHGWSDGSVNYLLSTDSPISGSERKLKRFSFALKNGYDGILDEISIQGANLQVAVVDACRDNPFRPPAGTKSLGLGRGLSRLQPPEGAFVVFSAGAGQTALDRLPTDSAEERYSVFTRHFLPLLNSGLTLEDAVSLAQTQTATLAANIGHQQRPSYYDETLGKTCLADTCKGIADFAALVRRSDPTPKPSACDQLYSEARSLAECYAYDSFVEQCSDHKFSGLAKAFLARQCKAAEPEDQTVTAARLSVQRCDILAASPFDPLIPNDIPGIYFNELNPTVALPVCREASALAPSQPRVAYNLARLLEANGDHGEAQAFYQVAATNGYAAAHTALGRIANGQDNVDVAIRHFTTAADSDDPVAMTFLALLYEGSAGLARQDFKKANAYLQRAVELEHPHALRELGRVYSTATLFPKDKKKALEAYTRAASLGDVRSEYEVALMYIHGVPGVVEKSTGQALVHLQNAAQKGDVQAQARLAGLYEFGYSEKAGGPIISDTGQAKHWYAQAARNGHVNSQIKLGRLFETGGFGEKRNLAEALRWYEMAAKQDYIHGLLKVAQYYETGRGVIANPKRAATYWVRAAEIGSLEPEFRDKWDPKTAVEVQRLLRDRGFYKGTLDGAIGAGTKKAFQALARDHRLNRQFDSHEKVLGSATLGWDCQC